MRSHWSRGGWFPVKREQATKTQEGHATTETEVAVTHLQAQGSHGPQATAEIRKDQEYLAPSERTWLCDPTGDFRPERLGTRTFLLLSAIESMAIRSSSSRQQIETPTAKCEPRLECPRPSRPREPAPPRHPRASRLLPQREERPATREVTCPRGKSRVRAGSPQTLCVGS